MKQASIHTTVPKSQVQDRTSLSLEDQHLSLKYQVNDDDGMHDDHLHAAEIFSPKIEVIMTVADEISLGEFHQ